MAQSRLKPRPFSRIPHGGPNGGFWLLNDGGQCVADATGQNNPGTFNNQISTYVPGNFGGPAVQLGNGALLTLAPAARNFNPASGLTLAAWIFIRTTFTGGTFLRQDQAVSSGFILSVSTTQIQFLMRATTQNLRYNIAAPSTGRWFHLAVVWDGVFPDSPGIGNFFTHTRIYFNGVSQPYVPTQTGGSGIHLGAPTFPLLLGDAATNSGFIVENLLVDNRAYGDAEALDLYQHPYRMFARLPAPVSFSAPAVSGRGQNAVSIIGR